MRTLRWAAELAVAGGEPALLGMRMLNALSKSEMLQSEDEVLVNAALLGRTRRYPEDGRSIEESGDRS